jgi:hypothetical protein
MLGEISNMARAAKPFRVFLLYCCGMEDTLLSDQRFSLPIFRSAATQPGAFASSPCHVVLPDPYSCEVVSGTSDIPVIASLQRRLIILHHLLQRA